MARIVRSDGSQFFEVVGWATIMGGISPDTDDRFSYRPQEIQHDTGEICAAPFSVEEKGMMHFTLKDIIAMGFTTDEYAAMLRYEAASSFEDHIRSEEELDALMASQIAWKKRPRDEELRQAVLSVRAAAEQENADAEEASDIWYRL
ncbi:hypothetical protein HFO17_02155 [Rhizobium laguerreae]|uniref:hypothetical protein n=1 Tax=Rhizobium laguerreae TaxID=1076926 RepID=UPI001C922E3D|nr:hypothetical protein [Rhizobium laguerreae]MBY3233375.1 hypothetical protein [Rhizobium laguerreae]